MANKWPGHFLFLASTFCPRYIYLVRTVNCYRYILYSDETIEKIVLAISYSEDFLIYCDEVRKKRLNNNTHNKKMS